MKRKLLPLVRHVSLRIKKRLPAVKRGKQSILYLLGSTIPIRVLEKIIADDSEWRSLALRAADEVGISEMELTQRLARNAGLPFARQLPRLSDDFIKYQLRGVERWYTAAAVPIVHDDIVAGIACVDPVRIQPLHTEMGGSVFLAGWSEIKAVLDSAARVDCNQMVESSFCSADSLSGASVVQQLLAEAARYGAEELRLDLTSNSKWTYQFLTCDGKTGTGSIAGEVHTDLRDWLEFAIEAGEQRVLCDREHMPVVVRQGGCKTSFQLQWGSQRDRLALVEVPDSALPVVGLSDAGSSDQHSAAGPILVVEDNSSFSRVLATFFKRYKLDATFARNGATALELLRAGFNPALLVCDVHMPGIHGIQLLEILRSHLCWQRMPVIMLTSDDEIETELRTIELGVSAFRHKHEDPRLLIAHIKQILRASVDTIELEGQVRAA